MVLRKLTLLSPIKFGIYKHETVETLLTRKNYGYLLWMYYRCSHIDFNDDIKETLQIESIEKPGTDSKYDYKGLELKLWGDDSEKRPDRSKKLWNPNMKKREHSHWEINKTKKEQAISEHNRKYSKLRSQTHNHGHTIKRIIS